MEKDLKSVPGAAAPSDARLFDGSAEKPARTFGLKAIDATLYAGLNNLTVGASSIFFTYLTNRGSKFGKAGTNARKLGELMEKRGDWIESKFLKAGLNQSFAANARMVFWSFVDGSFVIPAIKIVEDNREAIAKNIDNIAGTQPADEAAYEAEPKQSWGSVLGGRFLTAGVVVPTAAFMNKIDFHNGAFKWALENGPNLNQRAFIDPGIKLGEYVEKNHPNFAKKFGKEAFEEMAKVSIFEAFYTSLCTLGLYHTSRALAHSGKPHTLNVDSKEQSPMNLSNLLKEQPDTEVSSERTEQGRIDEKQPSLSA